MGWYADQWKKKNPYNKKRSYCGPNAIFNVPRGLVSEEENQMCYDHDASYEDYKNPYFATNDADRKFKAKGPVTAIGKAIFNSKYLLPFWARKEATLKSPTEGDKPMVRIGGKRSIQDVGKVISGRNVALRTDNLAPHMGSSFVNVRGMAGTKRKYRRFKRKTKPSRKRNQTRYGRRGRRRSLYFGRRVAAVGRRVNRISKVLRKMPVLETREWNTEFQGGSSGALNRWTYRVVDNIFSFVTLLPPQELTGEAVGWNMYTPLSRAVLRTYGANPLKGERYRFTYRSMTTMIQSPTNTPTFVEVYLLKPKFFGNMRGQFNPLVQGDQGTTPASENGQGFNPGNEDPYLFSKGETTVTNASEWALAHATSRLDFNPLADRNNMRHRFIVKKRWKFNLGPEDTKIITIRSKKEFLFKPSEYDGDFTAVSGLEPPYDQDVAGSAMNAPVQVTPSSRIMIIRWHGYNSIGTTTGTPNYTARCATTADPIIVRRWFNYKLYKMDTTEQVRAFDVVTSLPQEGSASNLKSFGMNSLQGGTPAQPDPML